MQQYILILLGVLVILLIGVIYFGWRKIMNLEIENSRNKYDIEAIRGLLSKILDGEEIPTPPVLGGQQMNNAQNLEKMQNQINIPFQNFQPPQFQQNTTENIQTSQFPSSQKINEESLESDIETLESTEDEIPKKEESSVSIESLGSSDDEIEEETEESEKSDESETEEETESEESEDESSEEDEDDEAQKLIESELAIEDEDVKEEEKPVETKKGDEPEELQEEQQEEHHEETVDEDVKNIQTNDTKKGNKKNVPSEAAKDFRVGYRMKSSNDGKLYEVVMNGNRKRWKLI